MSARISSLSRNKQIVLVCAGLLLVAVVGYFALIAPKRSEAAALEAQTADVQAQIDRNRSSVFAKALPAARSASVFRLAKAMPSDVAMSNVILELNQLAVDTGISFEEITPQAPAADSTFDVQPISVAFRGNFYSLSDFLLRLRNLVRVENGKLLARGRMFAVTDIKFSEDEEQKFPYLNASMTIDAFVPTAAQPATVPTDTSATSSTTETSTTPASASAASAGSQS